MEQLRNLHGSLKERYSTFAEQIKGLESLEGVDEKVLENAKDAFGLLTSPYTLVDHLFQIPEGYESIGSWNVSLGIPQAVRDYLRTEFASYSRGELPDSLVRDFAANRVNLVREVPSLMDSIRKDVADEHSGELETLLEGIDSAENMFAIARLLKKHPKDKPEPKSYAKHRLDGSSYELPPDPFADINSYFEGEPAVDAQDITEEDGIIQKPQILYITSPLPLFIEQIKAGAHPKKESSINYEARVTINCKTREAFIDPDPQS